ncbi:uncharacterized protein LOC119684008 [Teleopsis dalmanni]|uniref:uncharacterized protein LOC119668456 n=3 Tax=Teleopsis dalmanni TaxID=139649 RepID=UPI0018CFCDFE|nr:uncharacterized protein LOC119668456 [Teleopsis dalmanni]XP_037953865.1 uncharacterized protein LOC119684008 [Teleopsis dalmanni]
MDNKLNIPINNIITESEEEALLRSPTKVGGNLEKRLEASLKIQDLDDLNPSAQRPMVSSGGNTSPVIDTQSPMDTGDHDGGASNANTQSMVNSGDGNIETRKKAEYFTGAQKRRIKAMIRDGLDLETAKQKERERYSLYKASLAAEGESDRPSTSKRCRSNNTSPEETQRPQPKKPKATQHTSSSTGNQLKPTPSYRDVANACKVAIAHEKYPEVNLTGDQMELIKSKLLEEIDKLPKHNSVYGFITSVNRDGWLSLTCCNGETRNWLTTCVPKLKPFPDAILKVFQGEEMPKTYVCITFIPPSAVLPPEILMSRLEKQNGGICTSSWRILRTEKDKNGGETVTISVDEKSKNWIVGQAGKLYLNFTQIHVRVKGEPTGPKKLTTKRPFTTEKPSDVKQQVPPSKRPLSGDRPSTSKAQADKPSETVKVTRDSTRTEVGPSTSKQQGGTPVSSIKDQKQGPKKPASRSPRQEAPTHGTKLPKWMRNGKGRYQ